MGCICSRKIDQQVLEDGVRRADSRRYSKTSSSKWLGTLFSRKMVDHQPGVGTFPSLIELCIYNIREDIGKYSSFSTLRRNVSQQIFDELVSSRRLTGASFAAFRDCALQDVYLGYFPAVKDSWMDVTPSQGASLLSADLSGSDVTDAGLRFLRTWIETH